MRSGHIALAFACVSLCASTASAYPTSVVFAPTGDSKAGGDVGMFAYSSINLHPTVLPGATFLGFNMGVLPKLKLGDSGLSVGGLEVGVDLINADLLGTPDAYVKPVFNAKLQVLNEYKWVPNIAVGVMQIAPFHTERSLNVVYGSLTKTIQVGETYYGRITLGMYGSARPYDPSVFYATKPFSADSQLALLGGYESPAFGPFYFAVDYIGGVSELSSTNICLNLSPIDGATWAVGAYFGNDYDYFFAGAFTYLFISWNVLKVLAPKEPPPAEAPASAPAAPATGAPGAVAPATAAPAASPEAPAAATTPPAPSAPAAPATGVVPPPVPPKP